MAKKDLWKAMSRSITIKVPLLVPRILTPNRSREAHWGTVAKAKTNFQRMVYLYALDAKQRYFIDHGEEWEPLDRALLFLTFVIKNSHYVMDDDNAIAGWKHGRDVLQVNTLGKIQGAGIYKNDRGVRVGRLMWQVNKEQAPMTIIEVREIYIKS